MASGAWTREALSAGFAMQRSGLDGYLREHIVPNPPPSELPSEHGEHIALYQWTAEDESATDWRLA